MAQGFTRGVPIDTDPTMSLDSEIVVPSQSAVRDYVANNAVIPNAPISGATKTKITYDSKGLVTSGADIVAADISDSTDVGRNLVKLTNPSQITYLRINANNSVTALTASQLNNDLGNYRVVLGSDVTSTVASTALFDVTGLSFPITAGKSYSFSVKIHNTQTPVANGLRLAINANVAVTSILYRVIIPTTNVAFTNFTSSALDGASTAATSTISPGYSTIEGFLVANNTGTAIVRFGRTTAGAAGNTTTIKAGSSIEYTEY
jgi:hypothetical protein